MLGDCEEEEEEESLEEPQESESELSSGSHGEADCWLEVLRGYAARGARYAGRPPRCDYGDGSSEAGV